MNDTDGKKPLGLGGNAPRSGQVKQSFSHGRTKSVVVEVKRKLNVVHTKPGTPAAGASGASPQRLGDPAKRPAGISDAEMERRLSALRAAKIAEVADNARRAVEDKAREEERARKREEIDAREREEAAAAAAAKAKADEADRARKEAEIRQQREEDARKAAAA
jgi:translation initiation factor IF-2